MTATARTTALKNLLAKAKEQKGGGFKKDERFWKLTVDKQENGSAQIRFLPTADPEVNPDAVPWAMIYRHSFKIGGRYFIENCPTTLEQPCPICEHNSTLWDSNDEAKKKIASERKRKLSYFANIAVKKDTANPAAQGKLFLYEFGTKIYEKITNKIESMLETDDDAPALGPFDIHRGMTFYLKASKNKGGFRNYDASEFLSPSPFVKTREDEEKLYAALVDVSTLVAPDQFKSYDDLQKKFLSLQKGGSAPAQAKPASAPPSGDWQAPDVDADAPAETDDTDAPATVAASEEEDFDFSSLATD